MSFAAWVDEKDLKTVTLFQPAGLHRTEVKRSINAYIYVAKIGNKALREDSRTTRYEVHVSEDE